MKLVNIRIKVERKLLFKTKVSIINTTRGSNP